MQYVGFILNETEYTIPILKVQEIINIPNIIKFPKAPIYIKGVTNLRGKIIPIIDLKRLMNIDNLTEATKVVVISSGNITFGILVDRITGVIKIEDIDIEHPKDVSSDDLVEGVAKVSDKLIIMLDTKKIVPIEDARMLEEEIIEYQQKEGDQIEVTKKVEGMGGTTFVKENISTKDFYEKKGIDFNDPRYHIIEYIKNFMDAVSEQDYEKADEIIKKIVSVNQNELFNEIGKVTRKLHNSLKSFKESIDPKLKEMAKSEMPRAIDQLQFVISKTEEAANKTMAMVEKYILEMDTLAEKIRAISGNEDSVNYLKKFKNQMEDDLTEILTTQSFQDITGQIINKVIKLVGDLEDELVKLIANFGFKIESDASKKEKVSTQVSQEDVDNLLKEFGF